MCGTACGLPSLQRFELGKDDREKLCLAGCWHRYPHQLQMKSTLGQTQISPARNGSYQTFLYISQAENTRCKHPELKEAAILYMWRKSSK